MEVRIGGICQKGRGLLTYGKKYSLLEGRTKYMEQSPSWKVNS
jgi:hypothetical protein